MCTEPINPPLHRHTHTLALSLINSHTIVHGFTSIHTAPPAQFQGASVLTSVSVAYKNASCDTQGIAITGATTRQTWRDARINTAVSSVRGAPVLPLLLCA